MDLGFTDYSRFFLALVFVLALIALMAGVARRFGFGFQGQPRRSSERRLGIVESLMVDGKHRLVLVRRDSIEHLILIGTGTTPDLLVESGITPPPSPPTPPTPPIPPTPGGTAEGAGGS